MKKTKICIIGCGTYGAYLLKRLTESFDEELEITVIEIGDKHIKNEKEIGITSKSKFSKASKDGRYFGLGGTSTRWGGQILFFDERDNPNNCTTWNEIIAINDQYRQKVTQNILGKNTFKEFLKEDVDTAKVGIWLKYSKRNLYKSIEKKLLKKINFLLNYRVVDFEIKNNVISKIICKNLAGEVKKISADYFYLTAGAIESCRLLIEINNKYNILNDTDLGKNYGDHLSVELFKIQGNPPILNGIDLTPKFYKGNLITKRLIVSSKNGITGYVHPTLNNEVKVFSSLKQMLFGKQNFSFKFIELVVGIVFLFRFLFNYIFFQKMYVHKNNWSIQLDVEQAFPNEHTIELNPEQDNYKQKAVEINWKVTQQDQEVISEIKNDIQRILEKNNLNFTPVYNQNVSSDKIEDIYHPVGFIRIGKDSRSVLDMNCAVKNVSNLYHFSTAIFPSAKSINPTAAAFCFIESHIDAKLN